MLPKVRRTIQIAAIAAMVLIIAMSFGASLYQVYGVGGGHLAGLMEGKWNFRLYQAFVETLGKLKEPLAAADGFKGTYWSITLFGKDITDPLAGAGYFAAAKVFYFPLLLSMLIPTALALVLGRVFCGWICPVNTMLEGVDGLRSRLSHIGILPFSDIRLRRSGKYLLLLTLFIAALASGVPIFAYFIPYLQMGKEVFQIFYFKSVSWGIYFLGGLVLFELLLSRRGWCRYICPAGAFFSLLAAPKALRVLKHGGDCAKGCRSCIDACPMGLEPNTGAAMMECSQCGVCIPRCEPGFLSFRWRGNMKLLLLAGIIPALLVTASGASAHHIRGLPHYGYAENYPQNPSQERIVKYKQYYIFVNTYSFQGLDREKSDTPGDVQFYINIKDMKTGKSYKGPMEMEIERRGDKVLYKRDGPDEEAVYRIRHSFSKRRGRYFLLLGFDGSQGRENVKVKMKLK